MSALGKYAWVFTLVGALVDLIIGSINVSSYNANSQLAFINRSDPIRQAFYSNNASGAMAWAVFHFIGAGVCAVLLFIYVVKPFGASCAAKDWEPLIRDKLGGSMSKMWLMAIMLAGVSWVVAGFGVLVPAIALTLFGPGKGKVISK